MDTLVFSLNAVLPLLLLMALGYILKRVGFLNKAFLDAGNKFVFRVALPVYLFFTIYNINNISDINWSVIIYAAMGIMILFTLALIAALTLIKDKHQKGALIQGVFRANFAIIGIPIAEAIGGSLSVDVVALIATFIVPMMNILAVIALTAFVGHENDQMHPFKSTLIKIITNPLIIATAIGWLFLWIKGISPLGDVLSAEGGLKAIYIAISRVAQIASPFALIVLGGTFEFIVVKHKFREIFIGTFGRLVIAPLITLSLAVYLSKHTSFFNFTSIEFPALIALFASPTAVSGAVMAKEMHNDESLAVQYVVWTTSLSIISIFVIVFIFRSLGLI